jgi:hypothetical protein
MPTIMQKTASLYCTFTALLCKSLIINGAGEGNRTLVTNIVVYSGVKLFFVDNKGEKWSKVVQDCPIKSASCLSDFQKLGSLYDGVISGHLA